MNAILRISFKILKSWSKKEADENKTSTDKYLAALKQQLGLSNKPQVESVGENDPEQAPRLSEEDNIPAISTDATLPKGWKMTSPGGCSPLQSPMGGGFSSRRQAKRKMVVQEHPEEELEQMRDCLEYEGWQDHPNLPHNWKMKWTKNGDEKIGGKKRRTVFMAEDDTILTSGLLNLKHLWSKTEVASQTFEMFIDRGFRHKKRLTRTPVQITRAPQPGNVSGILNHIPDKRLDTQNHLVSVVFTLPAPRSSRDEESSGLGHPYTPYPGV